MKLRRSILGLAAAAAVGLLGLCSTAQASEVSTSGGFYINYQVNLPNYPVSDLVLFEEGAPNPDPNGYGITFGGCCEYAGVGTTVITDPFLKTNPIVSNFLLGVTTDLPGDADGQQHLVVFTNDSFASAAQGIDFGTLFPNTDETTLINDLTTNLDEAAVGETVYNQAVDDLFTFANGDATNAGIGFGSNSTFTAVAFSDGQIIGNGDSFTTPGGAVPEPASWILMSAGFGGLGPLIRRRRRSAGPLGEGVIA